LTHLSGLAGYVYPLGGVIVPILIWVTKKDHPVISSIAKQAVLLNVMVFLTICVSAILLLTVVLIPVVLLGWLALAIGAFALPIIGALRANEGRYYRYPVIGVTPDTITMSQPVV
jgi:uncharacterized Tic20 family protein